MVNLWNANEKKVQFDLLVGDYFGETPEKKIDKIRSDRQNRAHYLAGILGIIPESIVLEVGSGMGFSSKTIAKKVEQLHCIDISDSFLDAARSECSNIDNVSFHKVNAPGDLPFKDNMFDAVYSDAVFIHLNIYDIYWYLSEFQRVVKDDGLVWFNIMSGPKFQKQKMEQMANFYKDNTDCFKSLLCWNSDELVIEIAHSFGFKLVHHINNGYLADLMFMKNGN